MSVFVDTSALYALVDGHDSDHRPAARLFPELLDNEQLVTHSYVLVEGSALVQRRLGATAVRTLLEDLAPALEVVWVGEDVHRPAVAALLAATRRRVSLVDWVSFEVMRRRGIGTAFAFDRDFAAQGFRTVP